MGLIQIQQRLTSVTFYHTPEHFVAAFGTYIAGFFIFNPFFGTDLPPIRDRAQYDLFADCHRKVLNVPAGEFVALVTSRVPLLLGAFSDLALPTMHKSVIGQTSAALDIFRCEMFAVGEHTLSGNPSLV
jgi:hypothetical protein